MGLYLCVRDESDELDGVDVGSYADYGRFIEQIVQHVEAGVRGSKCPTLTLHSDADGQWSPEDCIRLQDELNLVTQVLSALPAIPLSEHWQIQVAKTVGVHTRALLDCFFDVDGEPLVERMLGLCRIAIERRQPILFQ